MPGRKSNPENYRFGFNGKENDNEIKGNGNSIDFGARMYDSRLGRWFAVDPLASKYPSMSPYNFAANNPIVFLDPDGNMVAKFGGPGDKPKIILRKAWGAREPVTGPGYSYEKIDGSLKDYYNTIVIHHSGNSMSHPTVNEIQDEHMDDKNKADIGYHFAIDKDGNIYEGRSIEYKGAHVNKANTGKIGIVLLGDFDTKDSGVAWYKKLFEFSDDELTDEMKNSLLELSTYLIKEYGIESLGSHKEVNCERNCAGDKGQEAVEEVREKTDNTSL